MGAGRLLVCIATSSTLARLAVWRKDTNTDFGMCRLVVRHGCTAS